MMLRSWRCLGIGLGSCESGYEYYLVEQGKFAWLCVEIDLGKPLLSSYIVKGEEYRIEYEGLHTLCFSCGKFGHINSTCSIKKEAEVRVLESGGGGPQVSSEESSKTFGPWTLVKKIRRKPNVSFNAGQQVSKENNAVGGVSQGSRFVGLLNVDDTEEVSEVVEAVTNAPKNTINVRSGIDKPVRMALKDSDMHNRLLAQRISTPKSGEDGKVKEVGGADQNTSGKGKFVARDNKVSNENISLFEYKFDFYNKGNRTWEKKNKGKESMLPLGGKASLEFKDKPLDANLDGVASDSLNDNVVCVGRPQLLGGLRDGMAID